LRCRAETSQIISWAAHLVFRVQAEKPAIQAFRTEKLSSGWRDIFGGLGNGGR